MNQHFIKYEEINVKVKKAWLPGSIQGQGQLSLLRFSSADLKQCTKDK